nr:hypothetical protein [Tanacetum cinerariifolium]
MLHVMRVEMVINSPWMLSNNWLVQKQTDFGKDISNPFMADNLPKIVWFSTHHITCMKKLASSKQTALGKDTSNPLIVDCLLKTIWFSIHHHLTIEVLAIPGDSPLLGVNTPRSDEDRLKLMELMVFLLQRNVCVKIGINAARLSKSLLSGKCDVTRLQALVDKKKIVISEAVICEILQINDAEGVVCLPNEEIFAGLAQMGTAMASAVICLSKGQRFNFSKYIFDSLVRNVDSSSKFYMYPRFIQQIIQTNIVDLSTHTTRYISPTLTQKGDNVQEPAAEEVIPEVVLPTPMSSSPPSPILATCSAHDLRVEGLENDKAAQQLEIVKLKARVKKLEKINKVKSFKLRWLKKVGTSQRVKSLDDMENVFNQGRVIIDMDQAKRIELSREEIEAEDEEIIKSINETPAQKATKRRKLSKEAQEAEDLRKRLEIVQDEDDDVFIEATPLSQKVPVADYQIVVINNKSRYKIKRANDTHQLYISFTTLLKNFDREDLEALWKIVRDRFSTSKPTNFLDEYLLLTLKTMFKEPDCQDAIWRNQKSVHGLALVKRWKLLTSCGIHVITLSTVQLFLLVERRYPLSRFTLEQLVNVTRLQVEEESEMSLELLRFTRQQLQEYQQG